MRTILIVIGRYLPGYKDGGPVQSVKNLTDRLHGEYTFHILTADRDNGDTHAYPDIRYDAWNDVENAKVWYVRPGGFTPDSVLRAAADAAVVYVCGCFNDYARVVMRLKQKGKILAPVVIAPMGLFSRGAFRIHYPKKKAYVAACRMRGWLRHVSWSVTGRREEEEVRRIIGKNAVCFRAQDIPRVMPGRPASIEKNRGELRIVFLSRISPKKNLDYALDVVRGLKGNVVFDIYGIHEDVRYYDVCMEKIRMMPDNIHCSFKGEAHPEQVISVFARYHVFLFPTRGENYGHVIYEAMAGGCVPVISDQTPWGELEKKRAGKVFPLERSEDYRETLQEMVGWEEEEYLDWRERTVEYAWEYQQEIDCSGYREIFELSR